MGGDDQHGAAGAGWTQSGRCVDEEVVTGIRLIWALFYVADEEPQMRHATRANGGDKEATRTRQMRVFYVADDEPQMRHETRANGSRSRSYQRQTNLPAQPVKHPTASKNN
ncbi:uncharacterized protein LOC144036986 [Vanacampus margaritifer]